MFEALLATADKKIQPKEVMNYALAVARKIWRDGMRQELEKSRDDMRIERAKKAVIEENQRLSNLMERARRRTNANHPVQ